MKMSVIFKFSLRCLHKFSTELVAMGKVNDQPGNGQYFQRVVRLGCCTIATVYSANKLVACAKLSVSAIEIHASLIQQLSMLLAMLEC